MTEAFEYFDFSILVSGAKQRLATISMNLIFLLVLSQTVRFLLGSSELSSQEGGPNWDAEESQIKT